MALALKGSKKATIREQAGTIETRITLTEAEVKSAIRLYDSCGDDGKATFILASWEFLMRVQSECFNLQKGDATELIALPPKRHLAVFMDAKGGVVIRWTRRKH